MLLVAAVPFLALKHTICKSLRQFSVFFLLRKSNYLFYNVKCILEGPIQSLWSVLVPFLSKCASSMAGLLGLDITKCLLYTDSFPARTSTPFQTINQHFPYQGTLHPSLQNKSYCFSYLFTQVTYTWILFFACEICGTDGFLCIHTTISHLLLFWSRTDCSSFVNLLNALIPKISFTFQLCWKALNQKCSQLVVTRGSFIVYWDTMVDSTCQ